MHHSIAKFGRRTLTQRAAKLVTLTLATACLATVQAAPIKWNLKNVVFDTGSQASGSFVYDADSNAYSDIEIDVIGDSGVFTYYTTLLATGDDQSVQFIADTDGDLTGRRTLALALNGTLTNASGVIDIVPGPGGISLQGQCADPGCSSVGASRENVVSGQVSTALTWQLANVTADNGQTMTGSFDYDASTNDFRTINITATNGAAVVSFGQLRASTPNVASSLFSVVEDRADLTGVPFMTLQFAADMTAAGGSINIQPYPSANTYHGVCNSADCNGREEIVSISGGQIRTLTLQPQIVTDATITMGENLTAVIDIQAIDDVNSEGNGLTYEKTGGADAALFNLDTQTGVLTFISPPSLAAPADADADNVYEISVAVTDASGRDTEQVLTVEVVGYANISVTPGNIDFGTVSQGDVPPLIELAINNTGNANLNISLMNIYDDYFAGFAFVGGSSSCEQISPGSSCVALVTLDLQFTSAGPGEKSGQIVIESNDPDTPRVVVPLHATIPGELIMPTMFDFGSVRVTTVGSTVIPLTVTAPMRVYIAALNDPQNQYSHSHNCPEQFVAPGSCEITINFAPTQVGQSDATLLFQTNDTDSPLREIQITGMGITPTDTDQDGVSDANDNCTLVSNPTQRDTDNDGFGNACDADLSGDGVVNVTDLGLLRLKFFTSDANADFNGDGTVNIVDLGILRARFFQPPGPAGQLL